MKKLENPLSDWRKKKKNSWSVGWTKSCFKVIPCNLSSPLGLLCDFRQFSVAVLLVEDIISFRILEAVQSPLSVSPLSFSLPFSIILLGRESNLIFKEKYELFWRRNYKIQTRDKKHFLTKKRKHYICFLPCCHTDFATPFHLRDNG